MTELSTSVKPEANEEALDVELTLCHNPESKLWQEAATLEAQVFLENGYVSNAEELAEEYRPYIPNTRMMAATRNNGVIGAMRIISYALGVGLKTVNDAKKGSLVLSEEGKDILNQLDLQRTVEVGTIALDKDHRSKSEAGSYTISGLYRGIYSLALQENTPNIIASFDEDYYERFSKLFGPSVLPLGPATDYMGSKTVPVVMNVDKLKEYFESINAQAYIDYMVTLGSTVKDEY